LWSEGWWHEPWFALALVLLTVVVIAVSALRTRRLAARAQSLNAFIEEQAKKRLFDQDPSLLNSGHITPNGALSEVSAQDLALLDLVVRQISSHVGDSGFSVDQLADSVNLSRRQLERRLKHVTGHAPADLIRGIRLRTASRLLREGTSVTETAHAVGFRSASHFSKTFARSFGRPPSEYVAGSSFIKS
jgi:AraC-like DNA-binding protein